MLDDVERVRQGRGRPPRLFALAPDRVLQHGGHLLPRERQRPSSLPLQAVVWRVCTLSATLRHNHKTLSDTRSEDRVVSTSNMWSKTRVSGSDRLGPPWEAGRQPSLFARWGYKKPARCGNCPSGCAPGMILPGDVEPGDRCTKVVDRLFVPSPLTHQEASTGAKGVSMTEPGTEEGEDGQPGRPPKPSLHERLRPWWRRGRWLFEVAELYAAARDATTLALGARAVVLIGNAVWPSES